MLLSTLAEVVLNIYNTGRVKATNKSYSKQDMLQLCRMASADIFRMRYYDAKKENSGEDFSYFSPLLSVQMFPVSDPSESNVRTADMSAFDLYRLPHNNHITAIRPAGGGCAGSKAPSDITLVNSGEFSFYAKDPDLSYYSFAKMVGRVMHICNLPPCAVSVEVEATFDSDTVDITTDVAYEAAIQVLGHTLQVPGFINKQTDEPYTPQQLALKKTIAPKEEANV